MRVRYVALLMCVALATARGQGDAELFPPSEAYKHGGEVGSYEFVVRAAKRVNSEKRGSYIALSSEVNHTAKSTLGVMIPVSSTARFPSRNPDQFYKGKQIRVTGKVELTKGGLPEIWVTDPSQITVTNASPADTLPPTEPTPDDFDPSPPSYLMYYLIGAGVILLVGGLLARQFLNKEPPPEDDKKSQRRAR